MNILEGIYRVGMVVGPVVALPAFLVRARGRSRIKERFGSWDRRAEKVWNGSPFWFHGASFGEVNGLLPLMKALRQRAPETPSLLTAMSVTGLDAGARVADETHLLPFDHPFWIRRALRGLSPRAFLFGETELWPLLLDELCTRRVPSILVNGRISDRAFPRYLKWRHFLEPRLRRLTGILVSSDLGKERFVALGADPSQVEIVGNAKYDLAPAIRDPAMAQTLRAQFFSDARPVLVLGSLRPREEEDWFPVIKEALEAKSELGVVVAPRHKEKFSFFAERLSAHGISFRRRSAGALVSSCNEESVMLLDTLGELAAVYSFADVGFVGGTLRDFGGHNPLEPAAHGAAVALGPFHQNAGEVVDLLRKQQAVIELSGPESLRTLVARLCSRDAEIIGFRQRGHEVWKSLQGATDRTLAALHRLAPGVFPRPNMIEGRATASDVGGGALCC